MVEYCLDDILRTYVLKKFKNIYTIQIKYLSFTSIKYHSF